MPVGARRRCPTLRRLFKIVATAGFVIPGAALPPSIGRAVDNVVAYVLSPTKDKAVCPVAVPGELHIGGRSLARGYLNRPELTAAAFVRNPFSRNPAARLHKTGDLVKYLPSGELHFLGRRHRRPGQDPRLPHRAGHEIRSFLKEKIPEYMVPSAFAMLERLPLTPNGKVDRHVLPVSQKQAV